MKSHLMTAVVTSVAVSGLAGAFWTVQASAEQSDAQERTVSLSSLPQPAQQQLKKLAQGETIEQVTQEGGTYEGSWHKSGWLHEATVTSDGSVLEFEDKMPASEIPAAVKQASQRLFPHEHADIERQMPVHWVIEGKVHEVVLMPDGRPVQSPAAEGNEHEGVTGARGGENEQGEQGEQGEGGERE